MERRQLLEKVNVMTAEEVKASAAFVVKQAKFNERLSKIQGKFFILTKSTAVAEKELAWLKSIFTDLIILTLPCLTALSCILLRQRPVWRACRL